MIRLSWNPAGVCAFCGQSIRRGSAPVAAGELLGAWRAEEDGELPACPTCRRRQLARHKRAGKRESNVVPLGELVATDALDDWLREMPLGEIFAVQNAIVFELRRRGVAEDAIREVPDP